MGQGHQILISSFPCLNNIVVQLWSNPFIHSGDRVHTNHFQTNLSSPATMKMGSRSPNSNQFFYMSQHCRCASLVKIYSFLQGIEKPFSNNLSPPVTLKMGSRSPKSNQFFYMSQQYRCASLVKIYSFLQEIGCRQASCAWKWGKGHQNLISTFLPPNDIFV